MHWLPVCQFYKAASVLWTRQSCQVIQDSSAYCLKVPAKHGAVAFIFHVSLIWNKLPHITSDLLQGQKLCIFRNLLLKYVCTGIFIIPSDAFLCTFLIHCFVFVFVLCRETRTDSGQWKWNPSIMNEGTLNMNSGNY